MENSILKQINLGGKLYDLGFSAEDYAKLEGLLSLADLKAFIDAAKKAGDDAQSDVDALETFVGSLPEDAKATTVTAYAKEVADAALAAAEATSKNVTDGLNSRVTATEGKLAGIDTTVTDAISSAIADVIADAPEAFDTLQEIAAWIGTNENGHVKEAAEMATSIAANATAIAAEKERAEGAESNLLRLIESLSGIVNGTKGETPVEGLVDKVSALEEALGAGGSVSTQIQTEIEKLDSTKEQIAGADGLALKVVEEDGKITSISGSIAANTYDTYGSASAVELKLDNVVENLSTTVTTEGTTTANLVSFSVDGAVLKIDTIAGTVSLTSIATTTSDKAKKVIA